MAHELTIHDTMFSVRERPWHGLGVVLADYPTIEEAKVQSNLIWTVDKRPIFFETDFAGPVRIPGKFATVRMDTNQPLGVVGGVYRVYQNAEMWDFIEKFLEASGAKLETAGSLFGGSVVWVLATSGGVEYVFGDPVQQFFLFRNSHNGSSQIQVCFTDIRVVCNNTLSWAIGGAQNIYSVRHTATAADYLSEAETALGVRSAYNDVKAIAFEQLVHHQMVARDMDKFVNGLFGVTVPEVGEVDVTPRKLAADRVLELVEVGAGADIPGVRGTAYGLLQAVAEYADHELGIRPRGKSIPEVRFDSAMWGQAAKLKLTTFDQLLELAA